MRLSPMSMREGRSLEGGKEEYVVNFSVGVSRTRSSRALHQHNDKQKVEEVASTRDKL